MTVLMLTDHRARLVPLIASLLMVGAVAGCSGTDDGTSSPSVADSSEGSTPEDDAEVFPGGRPLSEYEGQESHPWRVQIVRQAAYLLEALREVPDDGKIVTLDDAAFEYVISTCSTLASQKSNDEVLRDTRVRWSASATEPIDEQTAGEFISLSIHWACREQGTRPPGVT